MRQRVFCRSLSIVLGVLTLVALAVPIRSADALTADSTPKPTVVLVHGAFADASGWNDVTKRLQGQGYSVLAPANPERGLHLDSLYLSSVVSTIAGPVILVGHSYGGAVITNAATTSSHVAMMSHPGAVADLIVDAAEQTR